MGAKPLRLLHTAPRHAGTATGGFVGASPPGCLQRYAVDNTHLLHPTAGKNNPTYGLVD